MKKSFFGSILAILIFSIVIFLFPIRDINALTLDDTDLFLLRDDIIDTKQLSNDIVKIYYDTDIPVEDTTLWKEGKIIEEDKTKRLPNRQVYTRDNKTYYKYYTANQFIYRDTEWYYVNTATSTLADYEKSIENTKIISWLPFQILPVTAQSFFSETEDGHVYKNDSAVWATTRDSSSGSGIDDANNTLRCETQWSGTTFQIFRCYLPFDTSSLDDDLLIDTATLYLYVTTVLDEDNDAQGYIGVSTSTIAGASMAISDYDTMGNLEIHETSERKDLTGLATGQFHNWQLNELGTSTDVINRTGLTELSVREGHDLQNIAISSGSQTRNRIYASSENETGTTQDPYLLIVGHSPPEQSTSTPEETEYATSSLPCEFKYSNDLTMITGCTEIYTTSTTPSETRYHYFQIPFIVFIIIIIPFIWVANRLLIEFIKRWNKN